MQDPWQLAGKAVIVTGGTQGIGRAIALGFLSAGAEVLVVSRKPPETLPEAGARRARHFAADVRDADQCAAAVDACRAELGSVDVLVNNAGGSPYAEAATASARFSTSIITLNLIAPLVLSQKANAVMQTQPAGGAIVNIASVSGTRPSPGTAAYGAAKAGLLNLTETLAVEWAPKVRVNAITVGLVQTEHSLDHYGGSEGLARVARTVPLGRLAQPDDVASLTLYLASPLASYVTGSRTALHGGGEWPAFLQAARGG